MGQGYKDIRTNIKTWHFDNREPAKRKLYIDYWTELLLSGADQLLAAEYVSKETIELCKAELKQVATNPNAVFYFSFMQVMAKTS